MYQKIRLQVKKDVQKNNFKLEKRTRSLTKDLQNRVDRVVHLEEMLEKYKMR